MFYASLAFIFVMLEPRYKKHVHTFKMIDNEIDCILYPLYMGNP